MTRKLRMAAGPAAEDHGQPNHQAKRKAHDEYHAITGRPRQRSQFLLHDGSERVAPKRRGEAVETLGKRVQAAGARMERCGLGGGGIEAKTAFKLKAAEPAGQQRPAGE